MQRLVETLNLQTSSGKVTLAFELVITLLAAFCIAVFLLHDLIVLILSILFSRNVDYYAFQVFVASFVLLVLSGFGVFLLEWAIRPKR